jgi:hypothetical protein
MSVQCCSIAHSKTHAGAVLGLENKLQLLGISVSACLQLLLLSSAAVVGIKFVPAIILPACLAVTRGSKAIMVFEKLSFGRYTGACCPHTGKGLLT